MASGATLTIGTGATVYILDAQTLSVSGQLNVTGASVVINKLTGDYATYGIAVNGGGTMAVTGSTFTRNGTVGNENAEIQVAAGGHLTASGSTFSLDNVSLAAASMLNSGDMTGDIFSTTLTAPVTDVPLLTNNLSFNAVYVTGGLAERPVGDPGPARDADDGQPVLHADQRPDGGLGRHADDRHRHLVSTSPTSRRSPSAGS